MPQNNKKRAVTTILVMLFFLLILYFPLKRYISLSDLLSPTVGSLHNIANKTIASAKTILSINQLLLENKEAKIKIQQLIREIDQLKEISIENNRLKQLLNFKKELNYETIPAKVTGRDAANWYQSLLIDKGTQHGVTIDMPVVSYGGVVGKIIETSKHTSKVILITDKKSKIGGIIQESRYVGIIEGTAKNLCTMKYILKDALLNKGDIVVSSGFGGIYPKGLLIGKVEAIYTEKYGLYKYADILPSVDFNLLEEVMILKEQKTLASPPIDN